MTSLESSHDEQHDCEAAQSVDDNIAPYLHFVRPSDGSVPFTPDGSMAANGKTTIDGSIASYSQLLGWVANTQPGSQEQRLVASSLAQLLLRLIIAWLASWLLAIGADGVARSISKSDDVYRICDVVRAAHSMIIAIGPPASEKVDAILSGHQWSSSGGPERTTKWLRHWGSRLWTLPELLLCPSEHRVKPHVVGDPGDPVALAKHNFAERAWDDAELVKELVNHYEGSAILTQLMFVETALECFARRGTNQFSPGDIAYAIMGLLPLRQRPVVRQDDSGFQAFARLSLANDGGSFLGRLICLLPTVEEPSWYHTEDVWGAKLSDVHSQSQIIGVGKGDTLLVEGIYGASIQWDDIHNSIRTGEMASEWAYYLLVILRLLSVSLTIGFCWTFLIFTLIDPGDLQDQTFLSVMRETVLMPIAIAPAFSLLYLLSRKGTQNPAKAHLVGFEGHVDAATIERHLWGFNHGRLTSTAERATYQDDEEEQQNETQPRPETGDKYSFTLVNTCTMTLHHICTRNPPVAMFIAGLEGGLQRALLCSYDWCTNAFMRETVIRVGGNVLDRTKRVDGFSLRLTSPKKDDSEINTRVGSQDATRLDNIETLSTTDDAVSWKTELLYLTILLVSVYLHSMIGC
ncbi:hypothetical protein PT974_09588 [Cladobotryum mycophilum]|uniref:Transmembrane protein n=1 Tax=Cladobotryum mycophilum TaxID=491253 RepID=A0ABR0SGM3_9HYPO